jgi:hypothetical protein
MNKNYLYDIVEVKQYIKLKHYQEWTKVSRFLAVGLVGVMIREINYKNN